LHTSIANCYQKCFILAFQMLQSKELSEEVVQEVLSKFWCLHLNGKVNGINDLPSFLSMMVRNQAINLIRRNARERQHQDALSLNRSECLTEEMFNYWECERFLQEAINSLSKQRKIVFVLSRLEGWERTKIANALGI
jgi:RNA polymerase sigma factor (sigma-70 family)